MKRGRPSRRRITLIAFAGLFFIGAAIATRVWLGRSRAHHERDEIRKATGDLLEGNEWVARERLQAYESDLLKLPDGCTLLVGLYTRTHEAERLGATAEACLEAGFETREVLSGLARHRGWIGDVSGEQRILFETSRKFPRNSEAFLELATALHRGGRELEAGEAYLQALQLNPNRVSLELEALEFLETHGRRREALEIGLKLRKDRPPELSSPRGLLLVVRTLLRGPDPGMATEFAKLAKALLNDKPLQAAELRKTFPRELDLGN